MTGEPIHCICISFSAKRCCRAYSDLILCYLFLILISRHTKALPGGQVQIPPACLSEKLSEVDETGVGRAPSGRVGFLTSDSGNRWQHKPMSTEPSFPGRLSRLIARPKKGDPEGPRRAQKGQSLRFCKMAGKPEILQKWRESLRFCKILG